jgi:hypothetical protein
VDENLKGAPKAKKPLAGVKKSALNSVLTELHKTVANTPSLRNAFGSKENARQKGTMWPVPAGARPVLAQALVDSHLSKGLKRQWFARGGGQTEVHEKKRTAKARYSRRMCGIGHDLPMLAETIGIQAEGTFAELVLEFRKVSELLSIWRSAQQESSFLTTTSPPLTSIHRCKTTLAIVLTKRRAI